MCFNYLLYSFLYLIHLLCYIELRRGVMTYHEMRQREAPTARVAKRLQTRVKKGGQRQVALQTEGQKQSASVVRSRCNPRGRGRDVTMRWQRRRRVVLQNGSGRGREETRADISSKQQQVSLRHTKHIGDFRGLH